MCSLASSSCVRSIAANPCLVKLAVILGAHCAWRWDEALYRDLLATTGGVDETVVLQAAILHDTVEDTDTSLAELAAAFGEPVAAASLAQAHDATLLDGRRVAVKVLRPVNGMGPIGLQEIGFKRLDGSVDPAF